MLLVRVLSAASRTWTAAWTMTPGKTADDIYSVFDLTLSLKENGEGNVTFALLLPMRRQQSADSLGRICRSQTQKPRICASDDGAESIGREEAVDKAAKIGRNQCESAKWAEADRRGSRRWRKERRRRKVEQPLGAAASGAIGPVTVGLTVVQFAIVMVCVLSFVF